MVSSEKNRCPLCWPGTYLSLRCRLPCPVTVSISPSFCHEVCLDIGAWVPSLFSWVSDLLTMIVQKWVITASLATKHITSRCYCEPMILYACATRKETIPSTARWNLPRNIANIPKHDRSFNTFLISRANIQYAVRYFDSGGLISPRVPICGRLWE